MAQKPKYLKKLLTTASALAVLVGSAESMAGTPAGTGISRPAVPTGRIDNVNADFYNGPSLAPAAAQFTSGFNIVNSLAAVGGGTNMTTGGAAKDIHSYNAYGSSNTLTVGVTGGTLGSVFNDISDSAKNDVTALGGGNYNAVANANAKLIVRFGGGHTLNLTGTKLDQNTGGQVIPENNYSALGRVDFGNAAGTLNIQLTNDTTTEAAPLELTAEFTGDNAGANNNGAITVNSKFVKFSGVFTDGAAKGKVNDIVVNDGKKLTLNTNLILNQDLTLGSGGAGTAVVDVEAGKNVTVRNIKGDAAGKGILNFKGASDVTGDIGAGAALSEMSLSDGAVNFKGGATNVVKANTIKLTHRNAALKLSTNPQIVTGDIKNTTGVNGKGKVLIAGAVNQTFVGNIGEDTATGAIQSIEIDTAGAHFIINKDGAIINALEGVNFTGAAANGAHFDIKANNIVLKNDLGTSAKKLDDVNLFANQAGTGDATFRLADGKKIYATKFDLDPTNARSNTLELGENSELHANVTTGAANHGTIVVKGSSTINGTVGAPNAINKVLFDTVDKTLNVTKNTLRANSGIEFAQHSTLSFAENADLDLATAPLTIAADPAGKGTIQVNSADNSRTITLRGPIGDVVAGDKSLRKLEAKGGAKIIVTGGNAYIKEIDIGDKDSTLVLNQANTQNKIEKFTHVDNKGSLNIDASTKLLSGTVVSKADAKLKNVQLNGDRTLTLGDGVNIYSGSEGIRNNAVREGTLIFEGDSIVDAIVGANNPFKAIEVHGSGKSVDFKQDVRLVKGGGNGTVEVRDGATVKFGGNLQGNSIDADATVLGGRGTVVFNNAEAKEIDILIGNTHQLNTLTLAGKDLTFKQVINTANLAFTNNGRTTAAFDVGKAVNLNQMNITSTSTSRAHNIEIKEDMIFNRDIGTEENLFGDIIVNDANNSRAIVINTTNFLAGVTTTTAGKVRVDITKAGAIVLNLGDGANELEKVTFSQSATVRDGVYSKDVTVAVGKTATLKNVLSSSNGTVLNGGSIVAFSGSAARLASNVSGAAVGDGTVTFDDAAVIDNAIGSSGAGINRIAFTGSKKDIKASKSMYANTLEFGNNDLKLVEDISLGGNAAFAGGNIDLVGKKLTMESGSSAGTGALSIGLLLADAGQTSVGQLVVDGAATRLDLRGTSSLELNITDNADLPDDKGRSYKVFDTKNSGQLIQAGTVNVVSKGNRFSKWTFDAASGVLTQRNNAAEALKAILGSSDANVAFDASVIGDAKNTGDAKKLQSDLGRMDDPKIRDAVARVSNTAIAAAPALSSAIGGATQVTQNRVGVLSQHPTPGMQTSEAHATGLAAGDAKSMYGAWLSPFYNTAKGKKQNDASGFDSKTFGATIGADTMTNQDMTLGLAFSYLNTDIKHKNLKAGDKTKANTYVFSIYGIQQLTNEWFMQGMATYSTSSVKNREKRITSNANQTASAKYDTTSYGTEFMFGYVYGMNGVSVTPMAGLAYSRFNDGGYTETGTTFQNLTVTKKATSKVEGVLGGRVQMTTSYMDGMELTPEAHAFVRHDFLDKAQTVTAKQGGAVSAFRQKSVKMNRTSLNVGVGVNGKVDMYEYGIGYDLNAAKKYTAHQGTLKVRVNF